MKLAWLLLLALVFAGCSDAPEPQDPGSSSSSSSSSSQSSGPKPPREPLALLLDFSLEGCTGNRFHAEAGASTLQSAIDSRYTATGIMQVALFSCGNFTTPNARVPDTWFGAILVEVNDPGHAAAESHWYVTEMLAAQDVLAQVWEIAGYPLLNGTGDLAVTDIFGLPLVSSATTCVGNVCIEVTAGLDEATEDSGTFAWYHEHTDYRLQWTGAYALEFQWPGGSASANLPGSALSSVTDGSGVFAEGGYSGMNLHAIYPNPA
ncbi:MAG: hypothetical protein ACPHK8_03980 [Thermoplasmatota archaeon]